LEVEANASDRPLCLDHHVVEWGVRVWLLKANFDYSPSARTSGGRPSEQRGKVAGTHLCLEVYTGAAGG